MRLRGPAPSGTGTRPQTRLSYTPDGLNRYGTIATVGGSTITPGYDSRGNLTAAGGPTYSYSSENLLTAASGGVSLSYDPATRLYQTSDGTTTTRFAYDGADMIAEYNGSSALQRRYVFDPATGSPLVWYEGTGTSDRRFLHEDERGSVIATSNSAGTMLSIDSYDEYGIPASTNTGRFGYTGQAWLPELGMAYYRVRIYSPTLGRFMQTDPIGYAGGMNLYAYVGNDPVNFIDPTGKNRVCFTYTVIVRRVPNTNDSGGTIFFEKRQICGDTNSFGSTNYNPNAVFANGLGCPGRSLLCSNTTFSPPPQNRPCTPAGDSLGSTVADRTGNAHDSIFAAGAASERAAGNASGARAIARAGVPGGVLLGGLSEGIAAANDHANGMSAGRAAAIHGGGFFGGIVGGFLAGELVEPFGGGVPVAIFAGIAGNYAGTEAGEALGASGATAAGICR